MAGLHERILAPDVVANIPSAGIRGRLFFATDEGLLYRDNGSAWVAVRFSAAETTYVPAVLADWDYASDPGDVKEALDQAAERIADLEVGGGGGGGLTSSTTTLTPTTANDTATVTDDINYHFADVSGMTADRSFVVPAGTAKQEIILNITTGDDAYEYVIIGDTGITINGGSAATEWSRLFITGESIKLVATSTSNWQVVTDGRIPCKCVLELSGNDTTNTAGIETTPTWDTAVINVGDCADLVNYRVNIRRAGYYRVSGNYDPVLQITNANTCLVRVYQNGTLVNESNSHTGSTATSAAVALSPKSVSCAIGDYLLYVYQTQESNRGIEATPKSFFMVEEA